MRFATTLLATLVLFGVCLLNARAADKEVTLTGKILCAKCELNEGDDCQTLIKVKEKGKDVVYLFKDKGAKEKYHETVCGGGQFDGKVTGIVSVKDGKKWIAPKKVEYAKK